MHFFLIRKFTWTLLVKPVLRTFNDFYVSFTKFPSSGSNNFEYILIITLKYTGDFDDCHD